MSTNGPSPDPAILVIGEALVDIAERESGSTRHPGGSPLNVAAGLSRLGTAATLVTTIGDDPDGELIREHLLRSGAGVEAPAAGGIPTSTATARIAPDGSAEYEFAIRWEPAPPRPGLVERARLVHAGSLATSLEPGRELVLELFQRAREHALTSYDPNVRPSLAHDRDEATGWAERFIAASDIVKMSDEDAAWLFPGEEPESLAQRLLGAGPSLVAITLGGEGALLSIPGRTLRLPANAPRVVDTIGAGDSYMAGMLHTIAGLPAASAPVAQLRGTPWLSEPDAAAIAEFARACAAITVGRAGADLPWARELTA